VRTRRDLWARDARSRPLPLVGHLTFINYCRTIGCCMLILCGVAGRLGTVAGERGGPRRLKLKDPCSNLRNWGSAT
jgi:hypothetical protein